MIQLPRDQNVPVRNWYGSIVSSPAVVVAPRTVEELVEIMRDPTRYPAPLRAVGSNHSITPCGVADAGALVDMRNLNRILAIGPDNVIAEAGALYIDVARALQRHGLQFYVNVELGNLSCGSAACCGTKDAAMPGEFGQVSSYVTRIKMVTPAGERVEIGEDQPELLRAARSSYGLFGVIYEVRFKIRPLQAMAVYHESFSLDEFARRLPELTARGDSLMMYINPFIDTITVEFRRYCGPARRRRLTRWQWAVRNAVWRTLGPAYSYYVTTYIPIRRLRDALIDGFYRLVDAGLTYGIHGRSTIPTDQQIRYPKVSDHSRYTFSFWAFPEQQYIDTLRDYFRFCREHDQNRGYRCNITHVGYRIGRDANALLSYSFRGDVITIDPVSTGGPGWEEFLVAYNSFCSQHNGTPLFNQTNLLTREQVRKAFGDRLAIFEGFRRCFDPNDRMLNAYFRELLA